LLLRRAFSRIIGRPRARPRRMISGTQDDHAIRGCAGLGSGLTLSTTRRRASQTRDFIVPLDTPVIVAISSYEYWPLFHRRKAFRSWLGNACIDFVNRVRLSFQST